MKIKKIEVKNFKAVAEQTADFNGHSAIITGGNDKGPTMKAEKLNIKL